jgi:hypothetical protein
MHNRKSPPDAALIAAAQHQAQHAAWTAWLADVPLSWVRA